MNSQSAEKQSGQSAPKRTLHSGVLDINGDTITHILPSYELDQSLYGLAINALEIETRVPPPDYAEDESRSIASSSTSISHPSIPTPASQSVLNNLVALPYRQKSCLSLNLKLSSQPSFGSFFTNGDTLIGEVTLENKSPDAIKFELLILSLEGRTSLANQKLGPKHFERNNFLNMVDIFSSFTSADLSCDHFKDLSLTKVIPPYAKLSKAFFFKIPESLAVDENNALTPYSLANSKFSLPPSVGNLDALYPVDPNRSQDIQGYTASKKRGDLTDLLSAITYSINARVLVANEEAKGFEIHTHAENIFKFIPSVPTSSATDDFTLPPTKQLDIILAAIKQEFQRAVNGGRLPSDEVPHELGEKLGHISSSGTECSSSSSLFSPAQSLSTSPTTPYEAAIYRQSKPLVLKKSARTTPQGLLQLVLSEPAPSIPVIKLSNDGRACDKLSLDLKLTYTPPKTQAGSMSSEKRNLLQNPAQLFGIETAVDLCITKVQNEFGKAFPIDLDPAWFASTRLRYEGLVKKHSEVVALSKKLPPHSKISSTVLKDFNNLSALKVHQRHQMQHVFELEAGENHWSIDENGNFVHDMKLNLKFKDEFLEDRILVPDFQIGPLARFYSLKVMLNFKSKGFKKSFDCEDASIPLDIPLSIVY